MDAPCTIHPCHSFRAVRDAGKPSVKCCTCKRLVQSRHAVSSVQIRVIQYTANRRARVERCQGTAACQGEGRRGAASDTVCAILLGTGYRALGILSSCLSRRSPPSTHRCGEMVLRSMAGIWIVAKNLPGLRATRQLCAVPCITNLELRPSMAVVMEITEPKGATTLKADGILGLGLPQASISEYIQSRMGVGGCIIVRHNTHGKSMMRLTSRVAIEGLGAIYNDSETCGSRTSAVRGCHANVKIEGAPDEPVILAADRDVFAMRLSSWSFIPFVCRSSDYLRCHTEGNCSLEQL
jgi:hypothetical protein